MPYMVLVIEKPGERKHWPAADAEIRYDRMMGFAADLKARSILVAGESLSTDDGIRMRRQGGKVVATDGPFAEAKEIVGGFFLLDCDERDEALAIAESCPAAEWSTVELRWVAPCWDGARLRG